MNFIYRFLGIAPGVILWLENEKLDEVSKQRVISNIALKRPGDPLDIAKAIVFLIRDATYTTGQIIPVDGGRMLSQ